VHVSYHSQLAHSDQYFDVVYDIDITNVWIERIRSLEMELESLKSQFDSKDDQVIANLIVNGHRSIRENERMNVVVDE
jgi:hypothetical protein